MEQGICISETNYFVKVNNFSYNIVGDILFSEYIYIYIKDWDP